MRALIVLSTLLLAGCSSRPTCVTPCGSTLVDLACDDGSEARALAVFEDRLGWDADAGCAVLSQWEFARVHAEDVRDGSFDAGTWISKTSGKRIAGESFCLPYFAADVGGAGAENRETSLAHERAHALEGCADPGGYEHSRWIDAGILSAIDEVNRPL